MAKTRTIRRSCAGKLAHPNREAALAQFRRLIARGAYEGALAIYHCGACSRWHVGHRENRKRGRHHA